ncbi:MAG: hypothetical protein SPH62_00860 [Candidatus Egerieousia sp.]|nr:hypothetical protein [bacterium]MDY5254951.1 hypothetical protein [Candidatus Egerieousia sp.]
MRNDACSLPLRGQLQLHREAVTGWVHRCGLARGAVEDRGKRESQQAPARKATCRKGAALGSNLPAGSTIGKQLPAGVIGRMV